MAKIIFNDKIIFNNESNSIEVKLGDFPALAELKKQELMEECGLSEEEATKEANECIIDLELFYHKGSGLFGVESGAVESCPMGGLYSPYDGETELIDEEYAKPTDEEEQAFYEENKYNGEIARTIDTINWGEVDLVSRYDIDDDVTFYDCYQKDGGGYIGEFRTGGFDLDQYNDKEIENDLNYNLDL